MPGLLFPLAVLGAAGALWLAGLSLFLRSGLSPRRKIVWSAFLVLAGAGIGLALPGSELWSKFLLVLAILPVLALADVLLMPSRRGVSFWLRACGFEVCTVFAVAGATRLLCDFLAVGPLLGHRG
jgi:hypothetical protein